MSSIAEKEREKYEAIWEIETYSGDSPGAHHVDMFWRMAKPKPNDRLIDVGAGAGAASRVLKDRGLHVTAIDHVRTAWKHPDIWLHEQNLWKWDPPKRSWQFAYCCDVMEHIPERFVGLVLRNVVRCAPESFFSISFMPDHFGSLIGEHLHLTVKPFLWWKEALEEFGRIREARDCIGQGIFYMES